MPFGIEPDVVDALSVRGQTKLYGGKAQVVPNAPLTLSAAKTMTKKDSGGVFFVAKTSAYAITLPTPEQGLTFKFVVLDAGAFAVTVTDGSAHLLGCLDINNTLTASAGTTLTFVATGDIGDWVTFEGIDTTHYFISGGCVTAAKITVA